MVVSAGAGHHLHQFCGGMEKVCQALGGAVHVQSFSQRFVLGGNPCRTLIGVAHAGTDTTNGLHGAVGKSDAVGAKSQGLDKIHRHAQAAGDQQGDVATGAFVIQESAGPGQGRDSGHADVITENGRGGAGAATTAFLFIPSAMCT